MHIRGGDLYINDIGDLLYHELHEGGQSQITSPVSSLEAGKIQEYSPLRDARSGPSLAGSLTESAETRDFSSLSTSSPFDNSYKLIDFVSRTLLIRDHPNRSDHRGDGEVTRMGGGESYRPSTGRPPPRSPPRADTFRSDRDRRTPPVSDSYHPGNRRRSRSPGPRESANWRERPRSPRPRSMRYTRSISYHPV